jgi:hypothetical protein
MVESWERVAGGRNRPGGGGSNPGNGREFMRLPCGDGSFAVGETSKSSAVPSGRRSNLYYHPGKPWGFFQSNKRWALPAPEKTHPEGGGGFNPRTKPTKSTRASASEARPHRLRRNFSRSARSVRARRGTLGNPLGRVSCRGMLFGRSCMKCRPFPAAPSGPSPTPRNRPIRNTGHHPARKLPLPERKGDFAKTENPADMGV